MMGPIPCRNTHAYNLPIKKYVADKAVEAAAVERTCPLPTVFVPSPTQVEDIMAKIMPTADKMRDDDHGFPEEVSRRDMIQTAECCRFQTECLRGHTWAGFGDGCPDDWGNKASGKWARSTLEKAAARNGAALWRLPSKFTSAANGSVIQLGLTEMEHLAAVRSQLGLGHDVLMDRPSESETGELCSPAPSSSRSGASTF